jgi:hypothetical protein
VADDRNLNKFETVAAGAPALMGFRLLALLVEKGVVTQEDASKVMVQTAEDLRTATEDDAGTVGENVARLYERMAGWLQGRPSADL